MPTDRDILISIFDAALRSVDPHASVSKLMDEIIARFRSGNYNKFYVLSFGKASYPMASAVMDSAGDLVTDGIVITKYGHTDRVPNGFKLQVVEAGHPVPDEQGYRATMNAIRLLEHSDEHTFVLCLISGGGSSLLVAPYPGVSLKDKQEITRLLLRSGADIYEINTVRKHLSAVKGGRLASIVYPARIESLILSDVLGDRLDVIASGPVVPDETTFVDALNILEKYEIIDQSPTSVVQMLRSGVEGHIPETPKAGNAIFDRVHTRIIGNNLKAIQAGKRKAEELGCIVLVADTAVQGEARDAGVRLACESLEVQTEMTRKGMQGKPLCLISGGETTVTVRGDGKGGRNMELALAFAIELSDRRGISMLSAGTDGGDGPTDAAGAIVDGFTVSKGKALGIDPVHYLRNNDSYNFFQKIDELLIIGPTGTNVMDLQIILVNL
ncbi:MAG TPA: glycerate kinase [Syntrophorhabdaceae bacterium]|nr:glycerate kinase [Syntrophorhabdaceae bacterium]